MKLWVVLIGLLVWPLQANGQSDLEKAEALLDASEHAKAHQLLEKQLRQVPNNADAVGLMGRYHYEMGDYKKAQRLLKKARALNGGVWADYVGGVLALMDFYYGRDKQALSHLKGLDDSWITRELPILVNAKGLKRRPSGKRYYLIYTDKALSSRGADRYLADLMDLIFAAYSKVFPFKRDKQVIHRIYVFSTNQSYAAFNKSLGSDERGTSGYFSPSTKTLVINADPRDTKVDKWGLSRDVVDTIFHEGFHQFIHSYVRKLPSWFDEGLAEYFGPSELLSRTKLRVGAFTKTDKAGFETRYEVIKGALRSGEPLKPLPLKRFLSEDNDEFNGVSDRSTVNYAQAWSFIHFLLHSSSARVVGRPLIKRYFKELRAGKSVKEAHAASFGRVDLDKLERAWKAYVRGL